MICLAVVIGRASVLVWPDTRKFREKVIKDLKRELKDIDLRKNGENQVKVPADIVIDHKKSLQNIQDFIDTVQKKKIVVDIDVGGGLQKTADKISEMTSKPQKVKVDAEVDARDIEREIDRAAENIESTLNEAVVNGLDEHTVQQWERRLNRELKDISQTIKDTVRDISHVGDANAIKAVGNQWLQQARAYEKALRDEEIARRDLAKMRKNGEKNAERLVKAERKVLEAVEARQKAEVNTALVLERMDLARQKAIDNIKKRAEQAAALAEKQAKSVAEAQESADRKRAEQMRQFEAEFKKLFLETDRLMAKSDEVSEAANRTAENAANGIVRAHEALDDMAAAEEKKMRDFEEAHRKLMADTEAMSFKTADVLEQSVRKVEDAGNAVRRLEADLEKLAEERRQSGEKEGYWANPIDMRAVERNIRQVPRMWRTMVRDLAVKGQKLALSIDSSKMYEDMALIEQRMEEFLDEYDDSKIEIHPIIDETSLRATWARLKWLTRDRFATIHVIVSKKSITAANRMMRAIYSGSGLRNSVDTFRDLVKWMERLDKNAPALAMTSAGIVGIGGAVIGLAGSLSHIVVEFGRMAGAALALPGILGGAAFGIGTFIAAMQDFNREVPKIREDLGMLQDRISDRFWERARVPLLDAWNTVLPSLRRGLDRTAVSLGKWTARMSTAFAGAFDDSTMDKMFGHLADSIDVASESAEDLANIFAVLGRTGSEYLPRLAQWGNDVAESFSDWLTEAEATGELNRIMDTGIQKLKEFGKLIRETGEFIYILGKAAEEAGFSGLGEMADGLEDVNEQMKSLEGQKSLADYFEGAAKMADGLKDAIGSVVSGLGSFSGTFNTISGSIEGGLKSIGDAIETILGNERFQAGVEDLFSGLEDGLASLEDASEPIGDILGEIAGLAGEVVDAIGEIGGEILEAFGPEIADALEDLTPAVSDLADSLVGLIESLDDTDAMHGLVDAILDLPAVVVTELALAIDALAAAITALDDALSEGDWSGFDDLGKKIVDLLGPPGDLKEGEDWTWDEFWQEIWDGIVEDFEKIFLFENDGWTGRFSDWWENNVRQPFIESAKDALTFEPSELGVDDGWLWDLILDSLLPGGNINSLSDMLDAILESAFGDWKGSIARAWDDFTGWLEDFFSAGKPDNANGKKGGAPGITGGQSWENAISNLLPDPDTSGTATNWGAKLDKFRHDVAMRWTNFRIWLSDVFGKDEAPKASSQGTFDISAMLPKVENSDKSFVAQLDRVKHNLLRAWADFKSGLASMFSGGGGAGESGTFSMPAPDTSAFQGAIEGIREWLSGLTGQDYDVEVGANDNASEALESVQGKATEISGTPVEVHIRAMNEAMATIHAVTEALTGLTMREYMVSIHANPAPAIAGAASAMSALAQVAAGVYMATIAGNAAPAHAAAASAASALSRAASRQYMATIRGNPAPAVAAANTAAAAMTRAAARRYMATIRGNASPAVAAANTAARALSRVARTYTATVRANVVGLGQVNALAAAINRVRSKTVTVRVNTQGSVPMANGGILNGAGVQQFLNGGITDGFRVLDQRLRFMAENHTAQIASGGPIRVWAEPETGGEAYIPLAESKRDRSTAILAEVADRFGYRLEKYANGGTTVQSRLVPGEDNITLNLNYIPGDQTRTVSSDVLWGLKHRKRGGRSRVAG